MTWPATAGAQSLPSGWTLANVGAPALAGSATHTNGSYTVAGAGSDVWGTSDQFAFVYQRVLGDSVITARVSSLSYVDDWSKAGVMVRETLDGGSKHAFMLLSGRRGATFQYRTASAGASAGTAASSASAPLWVRIERRGTSLTAFRSVNGTAWTRVGEVTTSMGSSVYVGLAVTSHNTSSRATATFSDVTVAPLVPTPVPGWLSVDVGAPAVRGSSTATSSGFTVTAGGRDIWESSDEFHYLARAVTGDVDVVARVLTVQNVDPWTKAGVMIRSTLTASSPHASALVSAVNGVAFQRRVTSGGTSLHTSGGAGAAPVWLKLQRRGNTVTALRSSDGSAWTTIGSQTLTLPAAFYVGLAVASHDVTRAATATFDRVGVQTATNQPPTVSLSVAGGPYTSPASIAMTAAASGIDGSIARVEFYSGSGLLGSDTTAPYTFTWGSVAAGNYTLTARAYDNSGLMTASTAVPVRVLGPNQAPVVTLTSPAYGATYTAPASITLTATASDADGTIAAVEFYRGQTLIQSDSSAPYTVTWSNVAAGTYSLVAVARDNAGAMTTSGARSITVTDPALPRQVRFNPSPDHATVTRYVLEIFVAGADTQAANPVATQDLGRPAIVGECTSDIRTTIAALPSGRYVAVVSAVGSGGTGRSAPSSPFDR